ncbi:MAG: TolC family protein [Proteobacteria bacterium]|nr:TolC family protein [Pseudomonadota bacterium]
MQLAEKNSPKLAAARFHEVAAKKSIDIAKANYYPNVRVEAIDSGGFPGSSALTEVNGLMDSPFRSNFSAGVVAQQTVWDFGRTIHDVKATKHEAEYAYHDTRVSTYEVKQLALKTFYECTYFKTQSDLWGRLAHESSIITKEAQHFVNTGQRSIVDRYLSKAQTEEAYTAQAFFNEQLINATRELAVIMGVSDNSFSCPSLPVKLTSSLNPDMGFESSPYLARIIAGSKAAEERLQQQKSRFYPKIIAVASAGQLTDVRLVKKQNYAVGIGVVLPIFDMHTSGEIQHASAISSAKTHEIAATKQYLGEMNTRYDVTIQASKVRLQHLADELTLANKAFSVAKKRYFSLEGELIDLREAFRNLSRVETEIQETRTRLLQASGSKALLNGSKGT